MGLSVGTRPVPAAVARGAALAMERLEDLTAAAKRVSHAIRSKRPARTVAAEAIEHVAAVAAAGVASLVRELRIVVSPLF